MPVSPPAETMPGGAPLKKPRASSKRPCKYGPRVDGLCPKKPRAGSSSRTSAARSTPSRKKPPCKYGPRDADGYCPKKPKAPPRQRKVREYRTASAAGRQAGEVLRSKTATREQKKEAVKVLGTAVAVESGKKVTQQVAREARKQLRTPAGKRLVKRATQTLGTVAKKVGGATAIGAVIGAAAVGIDKSKRREAKKAAQRELAATKKRLAPQRLTAQQEAELLRQYEEHFYRQPVYTPTIK